MSEKDKTKKIKVVEHQIKINTKDKITAFLYSIPRTNGYEVSFRVESNAEISNNENAIFSIEQEKKEPQKEKLIEVKPSIRSLSLNADEFQELLNFIEKNYWDFKLRLEVPNDKTLVAIKSILNKNQQTVLQLLDEHNLADKDLRVSIAYRERKKAIEEFKSILLTKTNSENKKMIENQWQQWFRDNPWVLGVENIKILPQSAIDIKNKVDFAIESEDSFLDVIELKLPDAQFWFKTIDHNNFVPHSGLIKAITQAANYIFALDKKTNDADFIEEFGYPVKPKASVIYGRSKDWKKQEREAFRILNASYHNITILTFDHVLERANRILEILKPKT